MQKVEPLGRRITKLTGPIVKRVVGMPMPGDDVFDAGEALFSRLEDLHGLLDRPGHDLDPGRPHPRAGRDRRGAALVHLLPPLRLPDRPRDRQPRPARRGRRVLPRLVRGAAALRAAGRQHLPSDPGPQGAVLRPRDGRHRPAAASWRRRSTARTIRPRSSTAAARTRSRATTATFLLSVDLPFTEKRQINLSRHADELIIDLGSWRRTLVLPRILVDAPTEGAKFEDGTLKSPLWNPGTRRSLTMTEPDQPGRRLAPPISSAASPRSRAARRGR